MVFWLLIFDIFILDIDMKIIYSENFEEGRNILELVEVRFLWVFFIFIGLSVEK